MKKYVRLALGGGMLAAMIGLVGCGDGASDGLTAGADAERAQNVSDAMKKMGNMSAPKKAPPTVGKDASAPAQAGDAEAK
ncbi:hypothetical protein [Paludisphaera borealis]|uniref:Uncharacterized protein n=1 Tax=Paludisphaera borealis TaxID=1387353 RepID=A0A1U7CIE2_9BACT|nr:hypothetical protein [Paludisphaera borealis]APW58699.1 hypothetical protein BSF38_00100 [Paludisphaera borealis]